jgi:hypothetical protein
MDGKIKRILLWAAVALGGLVVVAVIGNVFVDFTADRVIEKLEKDYSPSPYGPGIDPDKVDMKVFHEPQSSSEWE